MLNGSGVLRCARRVAAACMMLAATTTASAQFIAPTSPLPIGRAFHGTAVLGDFLYVIGGSGANQGQDIPFLTVHAARIFYDGRLSKFIETTKIPVPRHYIANSTVVMNDTVYVIGGSTAILEGKRLDTVLWNRPQASGLLGPWRESKAFPPAALSCVAAFSTPGYLHMTGGLGNHGDVSDKVWTMPVNADGSPGEWRPGPTLPAPLWFHCAAVVGGRAWVWGGLNVEKSPINPTTAIYSAPVLASGTLGDWRTETTTLPVGLYSAVSAVAGPYLFSISPRYKEAVNSNDIWWTMVTPQGMKPWQKQQTQIPIKIYHACSADYRRGLIFLPGGKPDKTSEPAAFNFVIKLSPQARQLAEADWVASQTAGLAVASAAASAGGDSSVSTSDLASASPAAGAATPGLSFQTPTAGAGNLPGFLTLEAARTASAQNHQPMVLYFNSATAKPCVEQNKTLEGPDAAKIIASAVFASVDVRQYPQQTQQYGVFRVPTWVFFDANGVQKERSVGAVGLLELQQKLDAARK